MSRAAVGTKGVPRAEREDQIVAVAVTEFASLGYARASMVEIAGRAGISKPLIYQYFGSKDGLYLRCLTDVADNLLARLELAETEVDETVESRIHPLRAVFESLEPQRAAWQLLFDTSTPADGPIAAAANQYRARTVALAAGGSQRFLRARGIDNQLDTSVLTAVWMGVVNSVVVWWLGHPYVSAQDMIARCERLLSAITTGG